MGFKFGVVLLLFLIAACGVKVREEAGLGDDDAGLVRNESERECIENEPSCSENTLQTCINGSKEVVRECDDACDPDLGCVLCVPGSNRCDASAGTTDVCQADGMSWRQSECDPLQGMTCDANLNQCVGACTPASLGKSYIGCDYYPTQSGNDVANIFAFAIAVSNTSNSTANLTVEGGDLAEPILRTVNPNDVAIIELPWVAELKMCFEEPQSNACLEIEEKATLKSGGAYRVRSTQPVTVYQFSPLDYELDGHNSFTNDASLLLPATTWTGNYITGGWNGLVTERVNYPGTLVVTASSDNTRVTITSRADTIADNGAPAFVSGVPQTVTLNQGDVLQIAAFGDESADLTGSLVAADKPVQVISGHYCANVPTDVRFCDHLEESILPVEVLGASYAILPPSTPTIPQGKEQVVRFVAAEPNTTLSFEPPQDSETVLENVGDFIEISRRADVYVVNADKKLLVLQYMEGQEAGGDTGDPALGQAIPVDQYRDNYLFHAPTNYDFNYVDIIGRVGSNIQIDGVDIPSLTPIAASGLGYARVQLNNDGSGNHQATGDMPFGINVYGYGQFTSYLYPGGLNLKSIVVE